MSTSVTAFAGSIPENYDRYLGPLLFEPYAKDLLSRIDPHGINTLLEIACGTGRVTRHLRQAFPPPARLVATDLNPDMIAIGKKSIPDPTIEWQVADAQELPFEANSFDRVICQFGIMFVPDKARALSEAYRVLKPGGQLLFNVWDQMKYNEVIDVGNQIINSYFGDNPPVFYQIPFSMYDEKELESLLNAVGFKDHQIDLVKKEGISPSAADTATGMVEGNPVYLAICEKDPGLLHVIREALQQALAARFGAAPLVSPLQAWVVTARK